MGNEKTGDFISSRLFLHMLLQTLSSEEFNATMPNEIFTAMRDSMAQNEPDPSEDVEEASILSDYERARSESHSQFQENFQQVGDANVGVSKLTSQNSVHSN